MAEMNMRDDFQEAHDHKEAGMAETIVMFTVPADDSPLPPADLDTAGQRLLLQTNADPAAPDLAAATTRSLFGPATTCSQNHSDSTSSEAPARG